ncbi:MAG: FAD-dependent oxidoreductase [Phycisphaerae bacterium]|nr:FAD-dependent oxidoreductase [Phycisphaerae bacterium]
MSDALCPAGAVLTDTQATLEASRCLLCEDPPCVAACPAQVPVKHFIRALRFGTPRRAINLIRERNVFAGVCGLACPVDELCVGACSNTELSTPIAIGQLQHYAAVTELQADRQVEAPGGRGSCRAGGAGTELHADRKVAAAPKTGQKVAIIGGGPSGLAAAAELARLGHSPTVLEKNPRPGGICTYGVPSHRIPQDLVAGEIEYIKNLGVEIKTSSPFGRNDTLDDLFAAGYQAVYVAVGLQEAAVPQIPGLELDGVQTWKQLLDSFSAFNLGEGDRPQVAKSVIIVGGGSVAMDVASAAVQLGAADIDMVCLEAPREMPANRAELDEVWTAGARFHTRSMPLEITGEDGRVTGLKAARIRWKEPEKLIPSNAEIIPGTEYWLPGTMVIFAIGAKAAADLDKPLPDVKLDEADRIIVNPETGATSRAGVFAGGDAVADGGTTIVQSVAEGKRAGIAIDAYLREAVP